jgi:hypothetical protein
LKRLLVACLLALGSPATADQLDVMPFAGMAWGGTQKFDLDPPKGDLHVQASPAFGVAVTAYGYDYGAEIVYHYQPTDLVVRIDGLGEVGGVEMSLQYILFQIVRQWRVADVTPFIVVGAGAAGLSLLGTSEWEFVCSLGTGVRYVFPSGSSLRLTARMLAPVELTDNGFSFGAGTGGITVGGSSSFFQGDAQLGFSIPIWRDR